MTEPSYQESIDYLYSLSHSGIKLGLQNTAEVLKYFGDPQLKTATVHIAGTNGKGSTAAITESILTTADYKVGLYTSPHLLDFRERIQINRKKIEKVEVIELVSLVKSVVEKLKIPITFFEFGTILAFLYFEEKNTDINIIEVGLGGRLDATNLCKANVSIITSISQDHTQYLGEDLLQIAFEKGSIIKEGGTLFANIKKYKAFEVVKNLAEQCSAEIFNLGKDFHINNNPKGERRNLFDFKNKAVALKNLSLPILGNFQRENAALALSACLKLRDLGLNIEESHLRKGLQKVCWEGRLEMISSNPAVVLDCAHNEESVKKMTLELRENIEFDRCLIVLALMRDKNIDDLLKILSQFGDHFFLVSVNPPRGEDAKKLAAKLEKLNRPSQAFETLSEVFQAVKQIAKKKDLICITGSIFLIAEAKKYFNDENNLFNSGNNSYPDR